MDYIDECELEMISTLESLDERLLTVRAGRANPSMLSNVKVECYGALSPINAVANVTVPEARKIFIKPFDKTLLKDIEHAINESNLGIAPSNTGEMIILTIPELTEETRRTYVKQIKEMGENAKIALRNARMDANNKIKKDESLTEDDQKRYSEDVQELINKYNKEVDNRISAKESELMSV